MLYFFDTSAFLKRYHSEIGSEIVEEIFADADNLITISALTLAEIFAALEKHVRKGLLSASQVAEVLDGIHGDWMLGRFSVMDITSHHLLHCQDLIFHFHLTSSDGLILAQALELNIPLAAPVFVCSDTRSGLLRAAEAKGLSTLNPLSSP